MTKLSFEIGHFGSRAVSLTTESTHGLERFRNRPTHVDMHQNWREKESYF